MRRTRLALALVLIIIFITGCEAIKPINNNPEFSRPQNDNSKIDGVVTTVGDIDVEVPEINSTEFKEKIEAEDGELLGTSSILEELSDFSGDGYVRCNSDDYRSLDINLKVKNTQHYNIKIKGSSIGKSKATLSIDGKNVGQINSHSKDKFEIVTLSNLFIEEGNHTLSFSVLIGTLLIDSIEVVNSEVLSSLNFDISNTLINKNADSGTKKLMEFLVENYGENVISGQFASPASNAELEVIFKNTGRYPAIRFGDLYPYSLKSENEIGEIKKSVEWSKKGGIVGYIWHWPSPDNSNEFYTEETDFDITKAVTDIDVAKLSEAQLKVLLDDKKISEECYKLIMDIDLVSKQLKKLSDEGVLVLWRPLHEAGGGWFWWGDDKDSYFWLWKLLYDRQTQYHQLNNLIWIWNAQNSEWYVGDDYCDVISADIYNNDVSSTLNEFAQLQKISNKKLVALTEVNPLPKIDTIFTDKSIWSWMSLWSGSYIMDENLNLSEDYFSKQDLNKFYNSKKVITLDELPVLKD